MPKGETSRPLNAAERKALKTLQSVTQKIEKEGVATVKTYKAYSGAVKTLYEADKKQATRNLMDAASKKLDASNITQSFRSGAKKAMNKAMPSQVRTLARKK